MLDTLTSLAGPAFSTALIAALLIYATKRLHGRFTLDGHRGIQKVHTAPTPRVGGIAVALGFIIGVMCLPSSTEASSIGITLALACIPAFLIGFLEDLTKRISPRMRLMSHFLSAIWLVMVGGYVLRHTGFHMTDKLMMFTPVAIAVSVFAVAGMTNAVNIIDGYHGLASGSCVIMSIGLSLLAVRLGDIDIFMISIILAAATLGFMVLNFPFGKLFLGDAGAYFCGFILCGIVLVLSARHPGLSPWVPLLVIIYPVWEVLISIIRRLRRDGHSPGQPDRVHLHNLVSRSFARPAANAIHSKNLQNPMTAVAVWPFPLFAMLIAITFQMNSTNALFGIIVFQFFYHSIYRKLSLNK